MPDLRFLSTETVSGIVAALHPEGLPRGWYEIPHPFAGRGEPTPLTFRFIDPLTVRERILVMLDVGIEPEDSTAWMHLSASCPGTKLPSYSDLLHAKRTFLGERYAYQVFPPQVRHYTVTPESNVLHLWARLDGEPGIPDFLASRGGTL